MSKLFFYKLIASDFFEEVHSMNDDELVIWVKTLASDLIIGKKSKCSCDFSKKLIKEASAKSEKRINAGMLGGLAKASNAKAKLKKKSTNGLASSSSSSSSSSSTVTEPKNILPTFISQESMSAFQEMRKKIKKPMTDRAVVLLIAKLERFNADGYDANEILDNSTLGCWAGIFEPKHKKVIAQDNSEAESNRANQELAEAFKRENGL